MTDFTDFAKILITTSKKKFKKPNGMFIDLDSSRNRATETKGMVLPLRIYNSVVEPPTAKLPEHLR